MQDITLSGVAEVLLAKMKARFEAKFTKGDGCWLWEAATTPGGYGMFKVGPLGMMTAQRASWLLYRGTLPAGIYVLHNCPGGDNPCCVNPDHLFLGDHQANMDDKVEKGRQAEGEGHGLAKMNDRRVLELRAGAAAGLSPIMLGRVYGIDRTTVHSIVTGRTWDHVTGTIDGDDLEELLAVLAAAEAEYRAEVSAKCSAGSAKTAEILRAKRDALTEKKCTGRCGLTLPLSEFYVKDKRKGQLFARCKTCLADEQRERHGTRATASRERRTKPSPAAVAVSQHPEAIFTQVGCPGLHTGFNCVLSVIGPHAGEDMATIFGRKMDDIARLGRTLWLIRSHVCRPGDVQGDAQGLPEGEDFRVYFLEPARKGGSVPTKAAQAATEFSADGSLWEDLPAGLTPVTGNLSGQVGAWALVLGGLELASPGEVIDLDTFAVGGGAAATFRQGASTVCARQLAAAATPRRPRAVAARGVLVAPYCVWVR